MDEKELRENILKLVEENNGLTISDVSRKLGIHYTTASKYLAVMEAEKKVIHRQIGMAKLFVPKEITSNIIKGLILILLVSYLLVPTFAIPTKIPLNGRLTFTNDSLYNTTANFTFSLFTTKTGGTIQWNETQENLSVASGAFSALLGNTTPINLSFDGDLFLQITVNKEVILPRFELGSTPYSYTSNQTNFTKSNARALGDFLPNIDNSYNLGSALLHWSNGYFTNINATGFVNLSQLQVANDTIFTNLTGSVGIGTKTPLSKLHVRGIGGSPGAISIDTITGSTQAQIEFLDNTTQKWAIGKTADNGMRFYYFPAGLDRLFINTGGAVGINTSSPTTALTIKGHLTFLDTATAGISSIMVANATDDGTAGTSLRLISGAGSAGSQGAGGNAGNVFVLAEKGGDTADQQSSGGSGGSVTIRAGVGGISSGDDGFSGPVSGSGGSVIISGGTGGNAGGALNTGGLGGDVAINGGNAGSGGNVNGGSLYAIGGTATGSGSVGNILLGINSAGTSRGLIGIATLTPRAQLEVLGDLYVARRANITGLSVNTNTTPANYVASIGGSINVSNLVNATQLIVSGTDITLNLSRLNVSTTLLEARQAADNSSVARTNVGNTLTGNQNISGSVNASNHIGPVNRISKTVLASAMTSVNLSIPADVESVKIVAKINGTSAVTFIKATFNDDEQGRYTNIGMATDSANSLLINNTLNERYISFEYQDDGTLSGGAHSGFRVNRTIEMDILTPRAVRGSVIGSFVTVISGNELDYGSFVWTNRTQTTGVRSVNISTLSGTFGIGTTFIVTGEREIS